LDRDRGSQAGRSVAKDRQLAALHVDLQIVELGDLRNAVQRAGVDLDFANDLSELCEARENIQNARLGRKQARHAACMADLQSPTGSIADGVRQIRFEVALAGVEFRQRIGLRLEPEERAKALGEHLLVGRFAIDRIGADVDNCREPFRAQQAGKWV
jgi:hypothetical protein